MSEEDLEQRIAKEVTSGNQKAQYPRCQSSRLGIRDKTYYAFLVVAQYAMTFPVVARAVNYSMGMYKGLAPLI